MTRNDGTRLSRSTLAFAGAAQAGLIGWLVNGRAGLLWACAQALLLALCGLLLVIDRYLRLRRAHARNLAEAASRDERLRLAEDLHDVLGHELSLVALRAGALQLSAAGPTAERAAAVREQVSEAVLRLAQIVDLLRTGDPAGRLVPAVASVGELVARSRRTGTDVVLVMDAHADASPAARDIAAKVVQEGLTNAAKHAPGASVTVTVETLAERLEVTVGNDCDESPPAERSAMGTGLASLERHVAAAGGRSWTKRADGRHLLRASVPLDPVGGVPGSPRLCVPVGRRPSVAALRWALPPTAVAVTLVVVFYAWASHDATLEQSAFGAVHPGQPAAELVLPTRQARVRLTPTGPAPPSGRCVYYTDGNFPLAMATYEICVADGTVARVTDLRTVRPW